MATLTAESRIEETVAFAKSGNRLLAEHHFRQVMQETNGTIEDPAVWLMMAWLAASPQAMVQVLERFLTAQPDNELAKLGLRWARGMANLVVESTREGASGLTEFNSHDQSLSIAPLLSGSPVAKSASTTQESVDAVVQGLQQVFGVPASGSTSSTINEESWPTRAVAIQSSEQTGKSDDRSATNGKSVSDAKSAAATTESVAFIDIQDSAFNHSKSETSREGVNAKATPAHSNVETVASVTDVESRTSQSPEQESPASTEDDSGEFATELPEIYTEPPASARRTEVAATNSATPKDDRPNGTNGKSKPSKPSILVVDDSPTVRKLLTMMLTQSGYDVFSAVDGLDAVQTIATRVPQLIITDINMPRLDGYKLCKLVTKNVRTKHVPVVMISAGIIDRLRGKLAGCSGYLVKPITPGSLNAVVEFALQGSAVNLHSS